MRVKPKKCFTFQKNNQKKMNSLVKIKCFLQPKFKIQCFDKYYDTSRNIEKNNLLYQFYRLNCSLNLYRNIEDGKMYEGFIHVVCGGCHTRRMWRMWTCKLKL